MGRPLQGKQWDPVRPGRLILAALCRPHSQRGQASWGLTAAARTPAQTRRAGSRGGRRVPGPVTGASSLVRTHWHVPAS